ncbi:MAG TPA: alpha/beta fold hydrolase [Opitutus sp.]|nr:alpha/beta fold hydrolase [Opitutus sp.]
MASSLSLFHRDLGGAGNPPLVILHGLLGSSRNWQTAGKELTEKFHVLALDLRNHGASPQADGMSYDAMVTDVVAWMDAQGIERAAVAGHSMGGKVAMRLACRRPERVERLVVVDVAPKDYYWVAHRHEFAAMLELDLDHLKSRAEAEMKFESRVPDWGMRKFLTTNLERDDGGRWRWIVNLPAIAAALPELEKNPLRESDRFEGPVLFVAGGKSAYVSENDHATIRRHFPAAQIETIAQAGHNPHIEQRGEFLQRVLAWTSVPAASLRAASGERPQ